MSTTQQSRSLRPNATSPGGGPHDPSGAHVAARTPYDILLTAMLIAFGVALNHSSVILGFNLSLADPVAILLTLTLLASRRLLIPPAPCSSSSCCQSTNSSSPCSSPLDGRTRSSRSPQSPATTPSSQQLPVPSARHPDRSRRPYPTCAPRLHHGLRGRELHRGRIDRPPYAHDRRRPLLRRLPLPGVHQ